MESNITSSFIPRDTVRGPSYSGGPSNGLAEVVLLGAIVLFVASVALGIGVFLYERFLVTTIESKSEQIQRAQKAFEPALVQEFMRLDKRMIAAQNIVNAHLAPTAVFALLEQLTTQNVYFKSFDLDASDAAAIKLNLKGLARSVNSVAFQADVFGKNNAIENPVFANINRTEQGVAFDVTAHVNPAAINYANLVKGISLPEAGSVLQNATDAAPVQADSPSVFGVPPENGSTQQSPPPAQQ